MLLNWFFFPTLIKFLLRKKTFFCYFFFSVPISKCWFATQLSNLQHIFLFLFVCLSVCFFSTQAIFLQFFLLVFSFHLIYLCYSSFFVSNVVFLFWFKALKVILLMIFFLFSYSLIYWFCSFHFSLYISFFCCSFFFRFTFFLCFFYCYSTFPNITYAFLLPFAFRNLFACHVLSTFSSDVNVHE